MPSKHAKLFRVDFIERLRDWIATHHKVYPHHPPQGIYFESLVERAFLHSGWERDDVVLENPNSPRADINVGNTRLSLKTETGKGTRKNLISITKLCTTDLLSMRFSGVPAGVARSRPPIEHHRHGIRSDACGQIFSRVCRAKLPLRQ